MTPQLYCILEKFPGLSIQILNLYEGSNEFKTLCDDYFLCLKSLARWKINMDRDQSFIEEYSDLKKTLEAEVLGFIHECENIRHQ